MRIAHISDLHLRHHLPGTAAIPRRLSRQMPELLAKAVQRIQEEHPDLVVITGDLLDYPLEALDDPETQAQGERDLRLIAAILQELSCPYCVIPGNHDHPALVRKVFHDLSEDQVLAGHRVICFYDHEDEEHFPQRLGPEREKFLRAVTDADSPPQVHVQHYVVWPIRNESYPHTYREAPFLREAIVASGKVRLVLSGHYHPGIPPFQEGPTWFATVPAFCESPHPYWIYSLRPEGFHYTEHRIEEDIT